ncbi:MAG: TldD/PmbA family protein [Fibrobacter sp.]|jgi:TldD protein|nr:TldD/PmbA family protein [Fibrobacter sp.]
MNPEKAYRVIEKANSLGADFAELFVEETRSSVLLLKNKKIENASASTEFGVGIRLFFGPEVLYAFTSDDSTDSLLKMVDTLAFSRNSQASKGVFSFQFLEPQSVVDYSLKSFKDPRVLGQTYKLDFLKKADEAARAFSSQIVQVSASVVDTCSHIQIINSEGLFIENSRARTRASVGVTGAKGEERFTTHESPGALGGYELLEHISPEILATSGAERVLRMLDAGYITGGKMPVVMGNGFGGVIFHEACGHPLETESIRKKASPFCDKLGEPIANPVLTAIDDGTIDNAWGSLSIDDEGTPTQRTTLIENGVLKSFLSDRVGAKEVGVPLTGSARRESYKYAPVSRMRNTFIAPGESSLEDMISGVDNGLYAAKMAGGSVNPATGEFNFAVDEAYVIRNGKIAEPVRGATLIGKGHEILNQISMVGNDFEMAAGMCGASSGSVPVTVGQPSIKVDSILVGGR